MNINNSDFSDKVPQIYFGVFLYLTLVNFEIDTRSPVNVISYKDFIETSAILLPTQPTFSNYSGHIIKPMGLSEVDVKYMSTVKTLKMYVIQEGPSIIRRNWLMELNSLHPIKILNIESIEMSKIDEILNNYKDIFATGYGRLRDHPANIYYKA